MKNRIRVGIFFGGSSREREVSFAGGRTVYDNLDKELFEAVPIFVDEFGNLVLLKWQYIYRGSIRDFYPPVSYLPESPNAFQIYSESIDMTSDQRKEMLAEIGELVLPDQLEAHIDFAFLALHGERGEDGNIQGLLEWYNIPYSGSGILASAAGMNKAIQKRWLSTAGFDEPEYVTIKRTDWLNNRESFYDEVKQKIGFPAVVKSANQGSSIGVTVLKDDDGNAFYQAMENSFFTQKLTKMEWREQGGVNIVRDLSDVRSSLGFPLLVNNEIVHHPESALTHINDLFEQHSEIELKAVRGEVEVIVEEFISGREFSCIVIKDEDGKALALPPTEIAKSTQFFDYKSKYLPGLSRKITPISLETNEIERIRTSCCKLFDYVGFDVYARIDGFYTEEGRILLNDPNTTSGMMPSSFFFHQAAEIGLNPSQFLTYIIRTSLSDRINTVPSFVRSTPLLDQLNKSLDAKGTGNVERIRVAVVMGGYSTERHISVESGRNIFEKLASSGKYQPIPVFLTGDNDHHRLFVMPVNIMLKDNADDIKQKLENFHQAEIIASIITEASSVTSRYTDVPPVFVPQEIDYEGLASLCDEVFIALHGRPGEDGAIQRELDKRGIPYNGSGVESSATTIDKFKTNNLLRQAGFLVADGNLIQRSDWDLNSEEVLKSIRAMEFPLIAKPSDEGCSSAVKKLKSVDEVVTYAEITFRDQEVIDAGLRDKLDIGEKEEFPQKDYFLLEHFIDKKGAKHFLEITGGLLTKYVDGQLTYEVFEPSEALAEGEILSLAEKFLAGEGQNITPARFSIDPDEQKRISIEVRKVLGEVARFLKVEGYCRIDAFVRIFDDGRIDVIIIEINSLPGMTPATCIYHQAAINDYKPFDFIDEILTFGEQRLAQKA